MKIARVFPRKTCATPVDSAVYIGKIPPIDMEYDRVEISCTFSYDIDVAKTLFEKAVKTGFSTSLGGPAFGDRGEDFEPGKYLKRGYVITSRGCPNNCWFCDVPKREGPIRELVVKDGWNVLDSNFLATSEAHQDRVFEMLKKQPRKPEFTGGLEARRVTVKIAEKLRRIKTRRAYFAYDTPDDLDPLNQAGKILQSVGFTVNHLSCYVLVGFPKDSLSNAEKRCRAAWAAGFMPMAMVWRGKDYVDWASFQRVYARPAITRRVLCGY